MPAACSAYPLLLDFIKLPIFDEEILAVLF
jgi:hypothetical protein